MRCRRIRRELLWLARFGEFGPSSAPHLDHLASCRPCRDEVGFDRVLVEQLRSALAARIEATNPSARAWEGIVERMRQPEPGLAARIRGWSQALVGRLRVATAMAGTSLALVLALNLEVVPPPDPTVSDAVIDALAAQAAAGPGPGDDFERNQERRLPSFASALTTPPMVGAPMTPITDAETVFVRGPLSPGARDTTEDLEHRSMTEGEGEQRADTGGDRPVLITRVILRDADLAPSRSGRVATAPEFSAPPEPPAESGGPS